MSVDVAGGVLQPSGSYTASGWGKKFLLLNLSPAVSAVVMTWESVFYSVVYILCTVLSIIRACTSIYNVNTINIYYCTTGRAIWGNIQLEGGSIGPTEGRDNTEPKVVQ